MIINLIFIKFNFIFNLKIITKMVDFIYDYYEIESKWREMLNAVLLASVMIFFILLPKSLT